MESEKGGGKNRSRQVGGVKKGGGRTAARRGSEKEGEERKHGMLANETNKTRS